MGNNISKLKNTVKRRWKRQKGEKAPAPALAVQVEDVHNHHQTTPTIAEPRRFGAVIHRPSASEHRESDLNSGSNHHLITSTGRSESSPYVPAQPVMTNMRDGTQPEPPPTPQSDPDTTVKTSRVKEEEDSLPLAVSDADHTSPGTTVSPLWRQAVERIRQERIKGFEETQQTRVVLADALIKEVQVIHQKVDSGELHYEKGNKERVYYAEVFLTQLNRYAAIGDIAISHDPAVAALVWSGVRLLLQVGVAHYQNMAMISSSLAYLGWVMCCGEIYEGLYVQSPQGSVDLTECLVNQYTSMLRYLICVKQHLYKNTAIRITESLSTKLARLLEDLRECEKRTRDRADLAEKEATSITQLNERSSTSNLHRHLNEVRKQFKIIESPLDEWNKDIKRLCKYVDDIELERALDWVSNIQYGNIHDEHRMRRVPKTCNWLLSNPQFDDWFNSRSSSMFWLSGDAGTGKTILSSRVIDLLKESHSSEHAIAYFYCSTTAPDRADPVFVLRAIVRQLCVAYSLEGLPEYLLEIYERREKEDAGALTLDECKYLIIQLAKQLNGVWVVIDALDECDPNKRKDLFCALREIVDTVSIVRIFLSSLNEGDIRMHMAPYNQYYITAQDSSEDICIYVESELQKLYLDNEKLGLETVVTRLKARETTILSLGKDANGMFLPVQLRMQALRRETNEDGMDDALSDHPKELDHMYEDIMERIKRQSLTNCRSALYIIRWLFHTIDDSSPDTIFQALRVKGPGGSKMFGWRATKVQTHDVSNICCGLVVHDSKTGILRFSHATIRDFLGRMPLERRYEGEAWIANVCMEVLLSTDYRDRDFHRSTTGLFKYSARNWGHHVRPLILRSPGTARAWESFLNGSSKEFKGWASHVGTLLPPLQAKNDRIISPLWVACYYRLFDTFKTLLLLRSVSPNCVNSAGRQPLHHSAENGYLEFVKHLLENESVDVNCTDDMGYTSLMLAVKSNQIGVVDALLESCDVNMADNGGRTALMQASSSDRTEIIRLLIDTERCHVNVQDKMGFTALHHAALGGHASVVELLLNEASPDVSLEDNWKSTPLAIAAQEGHGPVVECLLKLAPDIKLNPRNRSGKTPLWNAAVAGHRGVVRSLLSYRPGGVDILESTTLLMWGAEYNQGWLVELLLERADPDINAQNQSKWTALSLAAWYGSLEALQWILRVPGVDLEHKDNDGSTPLILAARRGHTALIRALLGIEPSGWQEGEPAGSRLPHSTNTDAATVTDLTSSHASGKFDYTKSPQTLPVCRANVNAAENNGVTSIIAAVERNDTESLQVLLSHGADANATESHGLTALQVAAMGGHPESLQALLSHVADANQMGNDLPALHLAVQSGSAESVQVLLSHGADVNAMAAGLNALHFAAVHGHTEILQLLLSRGANVHAMGYYDGSVHGLAAQYGQQELTLGVESFSSRGKVAELFKEEGMLRYAGSDNFGLFMGALLSHNRSAGAAEDGRIHTAAMCGHTACLQVLLSHGADVNVADSDGMTALHNAACNGHTESLQVILSHGANVSAVCSELGLTALHITAHGGHTNSLQSLLSHGAGVNEGASGNVTALHCAAGGGHIETLQVLMSRGANINARTVHGWTALHAAASPGRTESIEALLSHGADINALTADGWTALHFAAQKGHTESLQALLSHEANIHAAEDGGLTALHLAAQDGHTESINALLSHAADINALTGDGWAALHFAAQKGHTESLQALLSHEANINAVSGDGFTALCLAAESGHVESIQALLSHGVNVNTIDGDGTTALHLAASNGHTVPLQALLSHGANINAADGDGWTALHFAASNGHIEPLQALLSHGVNVNAADGDGTTALHLAASNRHIESLRALLSHGVNINATDGDGWTALHLAATVGHTESLQALLSHGANVNAAEGDGKTALHLAAQKGHTESLQALLSHGANIIAADGDGWTALHLAAINGHTESLQALLEIVRARR